MNLPEIVKQVESHLTWLDNILSHRFDDSKSRTDYVQQLLDTRSHFVSFFGFTSEDVDDTGVEDEEKCNRQNPSCASYFAQQLIQAVFTAYNGNLEGAWEQLKTLRLFRVRGYLEGLRGQHAERLLDVMDYFVGTLEWSIFQLLHQTTSNEPVSSEFAQWQQKKISDYAKKWQGFQKGDPKSQAVILYFKATLFKLLPGYEDEQIYLNSLLEVVALDPDYPLWYIYAYNALRRTRQVFNKSGTRPRIQAPSKQEIDLCEAAYKLAPTLVLTTFNLALVLKDCVWMTVYATQFSTVDIDRCPLDPEETLKRSLALFTDAIYLAEETGLNEWVVKSTGHKCELLCHKSRNEAGRTEGLKCFLELLRKNPGNAYLHQKVGRIYRYGVKGEEEGRIFLQDLQKARDHFKMGLVLHQRLNYYRCLKDYMKLFKCLPPPLPTEEALKILTDAILHTPDLLMSNEFSAQVRVWRGCLHWIYNPEKMTNGRNRREACRDWIHVLENYPKFRQMLLKCIRRPPFTIHTWKGPTYATILIDKLKKELEKIGKEEMAGNSKTYEAISVFLKDVERKSRVSRRMTIVKPFDKKWYSQQQPMRK